MQLTMGQLEQILKDRDDLIRSGDNDQAIELMRGLRLSDISQRILNDNVGAGVNKIINPYLTNFQQYIPNILNIFNRLTEASTVKFWEHVPKRVSSKTKKDEPVSEPIQASFVLNSAYWTPDNFEWSMGEVSGSNILIDSINDKPRIVTLLDIKDDLEGIRYPKHAKLKGDNSLIIPLKVSNFPEKVYGVLTLSGREPRFDQRDLELMTYLVEDYFQPHLGTFEELRKDPLTSFYNQKQRNDIILRELVKGKKTNNPVSLLAFDIDKFKDFNDEKGHIEGDSLLAQLRIPTYKTIRLGRDLPIRTGGEEFLIVAPGIDYEGAMKLGERLRNEVEVNRFTSRDKKTNYNISVSVGVHTIRSGKLAYDEDTIFSRIPDFLEIVDERLYLAKNAGRNCVR